MPSCSPVQVTISGFCARTCEDLGAFTVRRFFAGLTERRVSPEQLVRLIGSETKRSLPKQFDVSAGLRNDDLRSRSAAVLDTESIQMDGSSVSFGVRLDPYTFDAEAVTQLAAG